MMYRVMEGLISFRHHIAAATICNLQIVRVHKFDLRALEVHFSTHLNFLQILAICEFSSMMFGCKLDKGAFPHNTNRFNMICTW